MRVSLHLIAEMNLVCIFFSVIKIVFWMNFLFSPPVLQQRWLQQEFPSRLCLRNTQKDLKEVQEKHREYEQSLQLSAGQCFWGGKMLTPKYHDTLTEAKHLVFGYLLHFDCWSVFTGRVIFNINLHVPLTLSFQLYLLAAKKMWILWSVWLWSKALIWTV